MVGIVGCGAIGSSLAHALESRPLAGLFQIAGLNDLQTERADRLSRQLRRRTPVLALSRLIDRSQIVIEATSVASCPAIVTQALKRGRTVIALSVGGILPFAKKLQHWIGTGKLLIPSGAIGGLDAIKAARYSGLKRVTLTTRKPPTSLRGAPKNLRRPVTLFRGTAAAAIRAFPQNINVAATLSLAGLGAQKTQVRVIADPATRRNIHEIEAEGKFGRMTFRMENLPSRQNPKTSLLAIDSALATLEQTARHWRVGT